MINRSLHFIAGAHREENGLPSFRRLICTLVMVATLAFTAGHVIAKRGLDDKAVDLVKTALLYAFSAYGVTRTAEVLKGQ